jgi:chemotaxis protein CheC
MPEISLSLEQEDALKELGNIGSGNAATALGQILKKKVNINVPKVRLLSVKDSAETEFMINPDEVGIAVSLRLLGDLRGGILVLFSHDSASELINILLKSQICKTELFSVMDLSVLGESSHILSSSYLNAVGQLLQMHQLIPMLPQIMVDRMDRLNKFLVKGFIASGESYVLPIENELIIDARHLKVYVTFLLELESVNKIFKIIGL